MCVNACRTAARRSVRVRWGSGVCIGMLDCHKGAAASFGVLSAAKPLEPVSAADGEVLCLNRHYRVDVDQIPHSNQTYLILGHFAASFRRDNLRARPGRKVKDARTS